jgi:hypothetical protein
VDPYRGSSAIPCARCREALERHSAGYDCPRGHGMWDPSTVIDDTKLAELGTTIPSQVHPGRCPACRKTMEIRRWKGVTIDVCNQHGVFVNADDADYYLARSNRSR